MTLRLYAFLIVLAIALAALAASEHKATNNGLPLVASAAPTNATIVCVPTIPSQVRRYQGVTYA